MEAERGFVISLRERDRLNATTNVLDFIIHTLGGLDFENAPLPPESKDGMLQILTGVLDTIDSVVKPMRTAEELAEMAGE